MAKELTLGSQDSPTPGMFTALVFVWHMFFTVVEADCRLSSIRYSLGLVVAQSEAVVVAALAPPLHLGHVLLPERGHQLVDLLPHLQSDQ